VTGRTWREARRYVLATGGPGVALLLLRRRSGWLGVALAGLLALFFRDPERHLVPDPRNVYAAADGVITKVEESVPEPWLPDGRGLRVTTFLGLQNVHVNRSPVAGEVTEIDAVRGGFAPAFLDRSSRNTRTRTAIAGDTSPVVVVQVAGLLARRISGWVQKGDRLSPGQRMGIIHLGSRTDVLLPVGSAEVLVHPGMRVRAGVTPLARYVAAADGRR
jgi:phosphatidylserine decarboxylase